MPRSPVPASGAAASDAAGVVSDGLAVLVGLTKDSSLELGGTTFFEAAGAELRAELRPGDAATIALPCVRMADKVPALLVVLQDRAILAWSKGLVRKRVTVETVPLSSVWGSTVAPGIGARHPVMVLTVQWADRPPWTVAIPTDPELNQFMRTCFAPAR